MTTSDFEVVESFPVPPEEVYKTWLSSAGHTQMTGSHARVSTRVNGRFEAWDGYISGKRLELETGRRIRQAWRTSEFGPSDEYSVVEILLEPVAQGTKGTIRHSHLPDDGELYRQGWIDYYFTPMKQRFQRQARARQDVVEGQEARQAAKLDNSRRKRDSI